MPIETILSNTLINSIDSIFGVEIIPRYNIQGRGTSNTGYYNGKKINICNNTGKKIHLVDSIANKFSDNDIETFGFDFSKSQNHLGVISKSIEDDNELFDYQEIIVNEFLNMERRVITTNKGEKIGLPISACIRLPCGFGKTYATISIAKRLGHKTLVVLKLRSLMKQWYDSCNKVGLKVFCSVNGIKSFMEKMDSDIIDNSPVSNSSIKDADIIIVPDKHLKERKIIDFINKNVKTLIVDEVHMYNLFQSSIMNEFMTYNSFPFMIGLTATPRNSNNIYFPNPIQLDRHIEESIKSKLGLMKTINVVRPRGFIKIQDKVNRDLLIAKGASCRDPYRDNITEFDDYRTKYIVNHIVSKFESSSNMKGCVITSRVRPMELLYKLLHERLGDDINILRAGDSKNIKILTKLRGHNERFLIISTKQSIGTGLDIPSINSLFLHNYEFNPTTLTQIIGRVERDSDVKNRNVFIYGFTTIKSQKDIRSFSKMISGIKTTIPDWNISPEFWDPAYEY